MLLVGRSRDRFPVVSMGIFFCGTTDRTMCPEVDSVSESEYLNFLEHSGPLQACNGTALPYCSSTATMVSRARLPQPYVIRTVPVLFRLCFRLNACTCILVLSSLHVSKLLSQYVKKILLLLSLILLLLFHHCLLYAG